MSDSRLCSPGDGGRSHGGICRFDGTSGGSDRGRHRVRQRLLIPRDDAPADARTCSRVRARLRVFFTLRIDCIFFYIKNLIYVRNSERRFSYTTINKSFLSCFVHLSEWKRYLSFIISVIELLAHDMP